MVNRLIKWWQLVHSSFWFIPGAMSAAAALLAIGAVALDRVKSDEWRENFGFLYTGGAEGASTVLGTIAGSMITIAGVVFSMTLIALSLASSQLGPRLLRNFMRDTINQVVLGTFVATFLYCLLVLRTIRRAEDDLFVPHLAVTLGVVLAVVSVGVLIYFIHHISLSIQADQVVARVGRELMRGIEDIFPDRLDPAAQDRSEESEDAGLPPGFDDEAREVLTSGNGYVRSVDVGALVKLGTEEDVVFKVDRGPSAYVVEHAPLVRVWPAVRVTEPLMSRVNNAFMLGTTRTPGQDIEFSVHQIVEIAVRALSPGVNDPFTAVRCVDQLASALSRVARREIPSPFHYDEHGRVRVVYAVVSFADIVDSAFNQIRQSARTDAAVTIRLMEAITTVAAFTDRLDDRETLRRHAEMIVRGAREGLPEENDRREVNRRYTDAIEALDAPGRRGGAEDSAVGD